MDNHHNHNVPSSKSDKSIDPMYQTYYGITITGLESAIMLLTIAGLIASTARVAGKRAAYHTICWIAPFMIVGRKISNAVILPALWLQADSGKCINCIAFT